MTSGFNVHDAAGYEQLMGRWSQKLAPLFIDFARVADGEKILDVGCGTGSLTFALARAADLGEIAAIDYSPVFVEEAIRRNTDPRIKVQQADACALPFEGGTFDRKCLRFSNGVLGPKVKSLAQKRKNSCVLGQRLAIVE
jgi:ubiquinone/menaquinone biosynthesis C-methylase UbiE